MQKITILDKKILYELDKDGRASYSKIAKNVGTTAQVVKYHYHKLMDNEIIKNFWAFVDYDKAGYSFFWGYWMRFSGITKEEEREMYEYLNNHMNVPIIMRCDGYADALIAIIAKDVFQHNEILQEILTKYGRFITLSDILVGVGFVKFPRSYLLEKENDGIFHISGGTTQVVKLSDMDRKIISLLQIDGRMELTKMAEILGVSIGFVHKRYKYLREKEVITKITYTLNHKELGLKLYRNAFKIKQFNKERNDELYQYCMRHPNINNYVKVMGQWQIMIDFEVKDRDELRDIIRDIKHKFNDIIFEVVVNEVYQIDKFTQMAIEYPNLYKPRF
ncbi:Lrp/AsnC family transcriptional regulator [Patescibacteria group bacterium]